MEANRLFILALLLSTTIVGALRGSYLIDVDADKDDSNMFDDDHDFPLPGSHFEEEVSTSLARISGRVLAQKNVILANYTCDKYPRVCRQKGSVAEDCCHRKCVNVMTDSLNCFKCGHKCKHGELCCKGKCINIYTNRNHCGGCNNKCQRGRRCEHGICGYA